jgi:hypothetical protein
MPQGVVWLSGTWNCISGTLELHSKRRVFHVLGTA